MDWQKLRSLAQRQYGLISRRQLVEGGLTYWAIRWKQTQGDLEPLAPGVFRVAGCPGSWEQRLLALAMAAGPGAALSHVAAAKVYRLDGVDRLPLKVIDLAVPRNRTFSDERVRVHRLTRVPLTTVRGLPVTQLPRTLMDLAKVVDQPTLELALDSAQRQFPGLRLGLEKALGGRKYGVSGAMLLRALVDVREGRTTDSALEVKVWRALRAARLPDPETLLPVSGPDGFIAEVDFAWPAHKVALHVDGYRWHHQRTKFDKDANQRSWLASIGWLSLMVTATALKDSRWVESLRRALILRDPQGSLF